MPDLDIVERRIPTHWRPAYRLMKGGHPTESVADAVVKATAAQLRADGGVPAFPEFLKALTITTTSAEQRDRNLPAVAREIERRFNQRTPVKELSRATQRHQALIEAGRALPGPVPLAKEHCWELARHHLFGRVEPTLIGTDRRFESLTSLDRFERRIRTQADFRLERLAQRIAADPANTKLRAPARFRTRRSTAELLNESILGSANQ